MPQLPALAVNPPNFRGVMAQVAQQKFNEARLGALQAQGQRADRRLDFEIDQYSTEQARRAQLGEMTGQYARANPQERASMTATMLGVFPEKAQGIINFIDKLSRPELEDAAGETHYYASIFESVWQMQQAAPAPGMSVTGGLEQAYAQATDQMERDGTTLSDWPQQFDAQTFPQYLAEKRSWLKFAAENFARADESTAPTQRTVDLPGGQQQQQEFVNEDWVNVGEPVARWTPKEAGKTTAPKLDWQYLPGGMMQRRAWRDGDWHDVGEPVNRWQPEGKSGLTAAQKGNNAAIVRSRKEVRAALKRFNGDANQLIATAWGTDPITRLTGGQYPPLVSSIKKALSRRTGDDGGYEAFRELFLSVSPPPEPEVAAETDSGSTWDDWLSGIADMFGGDEPAAAEAASGKPASGAPAQSGAPAELPFTNDGKIDVASLKVGTIYVVPSKDGGVEKNLWNGTEFEPLGVKRQPTRTRRPSNQ